MRKAPKKNSAQSRPSQRSAAHNRPSQRAGAQQRQASRKAEQKAEQKADASAAATSTANAAATDHANDMPGLRKSLKNRHIQLIALGGAIGTGLFYGSSESIQLAGPSVLLAYLIGGAAIFLIVRALSEMSVDDPKAGAFSYYASYRWWSLRSWARSCSTGSRRSRHGCRRRCSL